MAKYMKDGGSRAYVIILCANCFICDQLLSAMPFCHCVSGAAWLRRVGRPFAVRWRRNCSISSEKNSSPASLCKHCILKPIRCSYVIMPSIICFVCFDRMPTTSHRRVHRSTPNKRTG
jgi:hypothetical protein